MKEGITYVLVYTFKLTAKGRRCRETQLDTRSESRTLAQTFVYPRIPHRRPKSPNLNTCYVWSNDVTRQLLSRRPLVAGPYVCMPPVKMIKRLGDTGGLIAWTKSHLANGGKFHDGIECRKRQEVLTLNDDPGLSPIILILRGDCVSGYP